MGVGKSGMTTCVQTVDLSVEQYPSLRREDLAARSLWGSVCV